MKDALVKLRLTDARILWDVVRKVVPESAARRALWSALASAEALAGRQKARAAQVPVGEGASALDRLKAEVELTEQILQGCGDNSCRVRRWPGPGTNGGCSCPTRRSESGRLLAVYVAAREFVRGA